MSYYYTDIVKIIKNLEKGVKMVTVSNVVKNILDRQVFLQEAINRGIVSHNLLAKKLKPEIEAELDKEVKLSAIVMALRRNSESIKNDFQEPSFSYAIETIKTDIFYIVVEESPDLISKLQSLCPIVDFRRGGVLNITQGNFEVVIITNNKYKEKLLDLLNDEKVLEVVDNLISISLTYSKDFLFTPGILYDISRFLAWENINLIDIILTKTELNLIIYKKDLIRCFRTLGRFAENR